MDPGSSKTSDVSGGEWFTPKRFGLILGLALCAAFPKIFFGLHSFFYRDYGVLAYPCAFYQQQSFWRGELPLWNPLSHCGVPFLAQWGTNLYPLALIYLAFPLPWSLGYFCLLHLFLGGLGMYLLAGRWTENRFAASVAGIAYVFNGVTFSSLLWPNYIVALSWSPWVVLTVERGWREGGRWVVAGAVTSAMQMLSGVPEIILLNWLLLGVLWLDDLRQGASARHLLLGRLGVVVLLTAGLAAIQLLPFFDLLAHSQRDRSFGSMKWAMPIWGWANLLVPRFRCYGTSSGIWFQEGQEFITTYYPGAGLLVLAIWGAWRARQRRAWLLAGLALLCLILATGERGYVFGWLKDFMPFIGIGRYPVKFVLLLAFIFPLLVAWGVRQLEGPAGRASVLASPNSKLTTWKDELCESQASDHPPPVGRAVLSAPPPPSEVGAQTTEARRSLLALGAVALAAMAAILYCAPEASDRDQWVATCGNTAMRAVFLVLLLGGTVWLPLIAAGQKRAAIQSAILMLIVGDMLTHMRNQVPTIPVASFAPDLWQGQQSVPPPRVGESRLMITPQADQRLLRNAASDHGEDFIARRLAEWSNLNLLDNVPKVNGASTLQLREQKEVESLLYSQTNQLPAGLLNFLSVSRITSPSNTVEWVARSNDCRWVTCGQKPIFESGSNALQALVSAAFDPRQVVYLPPESRLAVTVSNQTRCQIGAVSFSAQRVELEVEAKEPSLVVVAQSYYHPWRATIDRQATTLLRANHAFQALEVPAGRHQVVLAYRDRNLGVGLVVSALTALGCALLWLRARRNQRPPINR